MAASLRVYLPCTGLGHEARGFETFTRECAGALRAVPGLAVTVFGGGGALEPGERAVRNLPRSSDLAQSIGALFDRDPYFIEQTSFFAGFLPTLALHPPDVVYFADLNLGNACWHYRRLTGARFKLLYYNGGPTTQPFTRCDLVQQVSPEHLAAAVARGEDGSRQVLLPHGMAIPQAFRVADATERAATRARYGIPADVPLVLSVGALNGSHKRMDAVIRAVAQCAPATHLLLLGAETPETPLIRRLADVLLGARCVMHTVPRDAVLAAYRAADAFVLASLIEGFGLAHLEALAAGLPCVAHETATSAYVGGPHGFRGDLRDDAILIERLTAALAAGAVPTDAAARHAWAFDHFSWERLGPQYAELLRACAAGRRPSVEAAA
jgi:glycosyltransferase involved in cell wall biosynthesis